MTATGLPAGAYTLVVSGGTRGETEVPFDDKGMVGKLHVMGNSGPGNVSFASEWRLDISAGAELKLESIWFIVRYYPHVRKWEAVTLDTNEKKEMSGALVDSSQITRPLLRYGQVTRGRLSELR